MKDVLKMKVGAMTDTQFAMFCAATAGLMIGAAFLSHILLTMTGGSGFSASQELTHALVVAGPLALVALGCFGMKRFAERCHEDPAED